jgi:cell division septum initiation protein DivIVA
MAKTRQRRTPVQAMIAATQTKEQLRDEALEILKPVIEAAATTDPKVNGAWNYISTLLVLLQQDNDQLEQDLESANDRARDERDRAIRHGYNPQED